MAQNLLGRMFNKKPAEEAQGESANSSAPAKDSDGLTSVERYLQKQQQPTESSAVAQEQSGTAAQQSAKLAATGVAKYVNNIKSPSLTGVSKYLVKQIIPEYQQRAAAAAKAAMPTGVENYLAKVTAAAMKNQPAVASSVEKYLSKISA